MVYFPDPVWEHIKGFAIDFCWRCGGECALPGTIPCWRKDLKDLMVRGGPMLNPYAYRRQWYSRPGCKVREWLC